MTSNLHDLVTRAADAAGFRRVVSCCGVENKFCNADQWEGNLAAFAQILLRLIEDED